MENEVFKKISQYLDTHFSFSIRNEEETKEALQYIEELNFPLNSSIFKFYVQYDAGNIFVSRGKRVHQKGFIFPELLYLHDIPDIQQFIQEVWKITEEFIPLTSIESEVCLLFSKINGRVFFYVLGKGASVPESSERIWNSFEDFLMEYLDMK